MRCKLKRHSRNHYDCTLVTFPVVANASQVHLMNGNLQRKVNWNTKWAWTCLYKHQYNFTTNGIWKFNHIVSDGAIQTHNLQESPPPITTRPGLQHLLRVRFRCLQDKVTFSGTELGNLAGQPRLWVANVGGLKFVVSVIYSRQILITS